MNREEARNLLLKYYNEESDLFRLLWRHSLQVAEKSLYIGTHISEVVDLEFVYAAALLHDIGIFKTHAPSIYCVGEELYIKHGIIGAELLRNEGLERYARVCERHTGAGLSKEEIIKQGLPLPKCDFLPETLEEQIVCYADKFYSKSNPENVKTYLEARHSMEKFGKEQLQRFDAMAMRFGDL
mgnify:FL=1